MDTLPFEESASRGDAEPSGLDIVDQYAFLALRVMYRAVKDGTLTRTEAAQARKNIIDRWTAGKDKMALIDRCADVWKMSEGAAAKYQEDKNLETADAFYKAVFGLK